MTMTAGRYLLVGLFLLVRAAAAHADPIVITGGTVGMVNGNDLPGFTLTNADTTFSGVLPIAGVNCCFFNAGDTVSLNRGFAFTTLPGQPIVERVNGVLYQNVFPSGGVTLTVPPFVAPPVNGETFTFRSTFQAQGTLAGFADANLSQPLFQVPFIGSGTVSVNGRARTDVPNYIGQAIFFTFEPQVAATPEPASLMLVATGAAFLWVRTRQSSRLTTDD